MQLDYLSELINNPINTKLRRGQPKLGDIRMKTS